MKKLIVDQKSLIKELRWDYEYHEPPELLKIYKTSILKEIKDVAEIVRTKKDPTKDPEKPFQYIDISSIDNETGEIARCQDLIGSEAPSRARKFVKAYDIIISTCRPTRGAIAVIPEELHGQICSTGFSVIRVNKGINPLYIHFALRLKSTIEQFKKFSTGSSYPAILDSDVEKTLIPLPDIKIQNEIVKRLKISLLERKRIIKEINLKWENTILKTVGELTNQEFAFDIVDENDLIWTNDQIESRISALPSFIVEIEQIGEQLIIDVA